MKSTVKKIGILLLVLQFIGYSTPMSCLNMWIEDVVALTNSSDSETSELNSNKMDMDHSCCPGGVAPGSKKTESSKTSDDMNTSNSDNQASKSCHCSDQITSKIQVTPDVSIALPLMLMSKDVYLSLIQSQELSNVSSYWDHVVTPDLRSSSYNIDFKQSYLI